MAKTSKKDARIMFEAANLVADTNYRVPMESVYSLLEYRKKRKKKADKNAGDNEDKYYLNDEYAAYLELIRMLGNGIGSKINDLRLGNKTISEKIKEMLYILGVDLSSQELNQILKGEKSAEEILNYQAQLAWQLIFETNQNGKVIVHEDIADNLLVIAKNYAISDIIIEREKNNYERSASEHVMETIGKTQDYVAGIEEEPQRLSYTEKVEQQHLEDLNERERKLRLYIGHMQGYDRDRDGDGSRGLDPVTGYVIDYDDVYIADKKEVSRDTNR